MTTSETTTAASLPRWDMAPVYPGLASVEFREGFARLLMGIDSLAVLYDELGIGTDKIVLVLDDGKSLERSWCGRMRCWTT